MTFTTCFKKQAGKQPKKQTYVMRNQSIHLMTQEMVRISIAIPITLPLEELDWGNDNEHIEGHKKAPRQHSNIQIVDRSNSTTAAERSCAVAIPLIYDAQTHYIANNINTYTNILIRTQQRT